MNQRYDLLAFSLILFSVLLTVAMGIVPSAMLEIGQSPYVFLKEWQTLIAGILALVVAIFALRPVWRQVAKMNIQSSIMARDVLARRLSQTEARMQENAAAVSSITSDFLRDIVIWDGRDEPHYEIDSQWAHSAEQTAFRAAQQLQQYQDSRMDTAEIDRVRGRLIAATRQLDACLDKIHRPDSTDFDDPFYEITEKQKQAIETEAESARDELPECILDVSRQGEALDLAFAVELEKLRSKIRLIDDLIVKDEVS
jgi:hypothetical protein